MDDNPESMQVSTAMKDWANFRVSAPRKYCCPYCPPFQVSLELDLVVAELVGCKRRRGKDRGPPVCLPALKVTMHFRQANSVASNRSCLNRATTSCKACISDMILFSFWESVLSLFMPRIEIWDKYSNMKAFSCFNIDF